MPFLRKDIAVVPPRDAVAEITLRLATTDDAEVLSDMVRELAEYEHLEASNRCTPQALREELARPDGLEAVLAECQGYAVGMATFFQTYSTFAAARGLYLEDIFVRPTYRLRGVGTKLLQHIVQLAVDRKYGRVEWTTLIWNTQAIEFYESMGAQPNNAWTTYRLSGERLHRVAQGDTFPPGG